MAIEDDPDKPDKRWQPHLTWPVLLLFGIALYEATAQPGLAAAITCAKFGWPDFQAAFWLRRVDPDRRRGVACFWYYMAFGLWKVAILASLMMFGLLMVGSVQQVRRGGIPGSPVLSGVLIAAGVGFAASVLTTYVALSITLRSGVKIWLGFAPHSARRKRYWPPYRGHVNAAPFVTVTTLILTLWGILPVLLILAAKGGRFHAIVPIAIPFVAMFAFPAFIMIFSVLDQRVFAQGPQDCWESEDGAVFFESADGESVS